MDASAYLCTWKTSLVVFGRERKMEITALDEVPEYHTKGLIPLPFTFYTTSMFQKINYEFILDTSRRNQRRESEVMLHCTQGKKFVDIPTSVFCMKPQFTDGKINDSHPMHDGLNAMLTQVLTDVEKTEIEAFRKDIQCSVQTIYSIYVDHLNTTLPLIDFCAAVMTYKSSENKKTFWQKCFDNIKNFRNFTAWIGGICKPSDKGNLTAFPRFNRLSGEI